MSTREGNMLTEGDFWNFMKAQRAAEARGEETFECPICRSEAHWKRNDYNGHIQARCHGCGMKVME